MTDELYESSTPVVQFSAFDASKAFAAAAAAAFNSACPVGSRVCVKMAGGDNGRLPNEFVVTVTTGEAFACTVAFGYVAMVPVEGDKMASVKCVRWAA